MNQAGRNALLIRLGISQADLAKELGVRPASISQVISGRVRSRRVERHVSERTGVPLATLWPEWYGGDVVVVDQVREQGAGYAVPSLGADAVALSAEERRVVHLLRAMTPEQRARGLQSLKLVLADLDAGSGSTVTASGKGSRAAGRDIKGK